MSGSHSPTLPDPPTHTVKLKDILLVYLFVLISVCLSVVLSLCRSVCLLASCMSLCLSVCRSIGLSLVDFSLSIHSHYPSTCQSSCQAICLSIRRTSYACFRICCYVILLSMPVMLYYCYPYICSYTWADPEGGTGGPDPPWNFGKNVLIGFVKWYWFDIAQHLCKIQT